MKTTLDHLPERQQQELAHVRATLLTEFEAALRKGAGGTSDWRKGGKVLKIILFGSYARTDWVDEPDNGYLSDFDLLVIVSHPKLTDIADYWWEAEGSCNSKPPNMDAARTTKTTTRAPIAQTDWSAICRFCPDQAAATPSRAKATERPST